MLNRKATMDQIDVLKKKKQQFKNFLIGLKIQETLLGLPSSLFVLIGMFDNVLKLQVEIN